MDLKRQMEEIREVSGTDPTRALRLVREFRKNLKLSEDIDPKEMLYMQAFSETYLCQALLRLGNIKKAEVSGYKALKLQQKGDITEFLLMTYNMLGYICGMLDNYVGASTYFCAGISRAAEIKDYNIQRLLYSNFGVSFTKLGEYEKAKQYFDKSYEMIELANYSKEKKKAAIYAFHVDLGDYYFGIGEYEKALQSLEGTGYDYDVMKVKVAYATNRLEEAEIYLGQLLDSKLEFSNHLEQFGQFRDIIQYAINLKHQYYTTVCLERLLESAKKTDIPNFWSCYYENLIKATELFSWEMKENIYERFYFYHRQLTTLVLETECAGINNEYDLFYGHRRQKALEKKHARLKKLAMMDELTKVYNRSGFQECICEKLKEAKRKQLPFGVCMVDVDKFKTLNDTYGHLVGDICLKVVAKVIKTTFGTEASVCRYGGDEFAIITVGMHSFLFEESLKNLISNKRLKTVIQNELNKSRKNEELSDTYVAMNGRPVTLSIGAVNCIPKDEYTHTDYIYAADKLLYDVKNSTRNDYKMGTEVQ